MVDSGISVIVASRDAHCAQPDARQWAHISATGRHHAVIPSPARSGSCWPTLVGGVRSPWSSATRHRTIRCSLGVARRTASARGSGPGDQALLRRYLAAHAAQRWPGGYGPPTLPPCAGRAARRIWWPWSSRRESASRPDTSGPRGHSTDPIATHERRQRPLTRCTIRACLRGRDTGRHRHLRPGRHAQRGLHLAGGLYVDEGHVALSFQFFQQDAPEHPGQPRATVLLGSIRSRHATFACNCATCAAPRLPGCLSERMRAQLAGIAFARRHGGCVRAKGSDVYAVDHIEAPARRGSPAAPARADLLAAVRPAASSGDALQRPGRTAAGVAGRPARTPRRALRHGADVSMHRRASSIPWPALVTRHSGVGSRSVCQGVIGMAAARGQRRCASASMTVMPRSTATHLQQPGRERRHPGARHPYLCWRRRTASWFCHDQRRGRRWACCSWKARWICSFIP